MCDLHHDEPGQSAEPGNVTDFVNDLVVALQNSRIYSPDHPRVQDAIESLARGLPERLTALEADAIVIGAADGDLFFGERPLRATSRSAPRLLQSLEAMGSGGLRFRRQATEHDFLVLARLLGGSKIDELDVKTANHELQQEGCRGIEFLDAYSAGSGSGDVTDFAAGVLGGDRQDRAAEDRVTELQIPLRLYQTLFDHLTQVMVRVIQGTGFQLRETKTYVEEILARLNEDAKSMMSVSHYQVTHADIFQFRHSIRVACVALNFARAMTDTEELLLRIGAAALLHDVGKVAVSGEILHSRGRLSPDEFKEMSLHTVKGAEILLQLEETDRMAVASAFGHHRTLDDKGYPQVLHRGPLSVGTRIIKICDVYEALTAKRAYKEAHSPLRAYRIMLSMENHFDLPLLRRFTKLNGIYPVGELVTLSTGERARVHAQTDDIQRPAVLLDRTQDGEPIAEDEQPLLDLREERDGSRPEITRLLQEDLAVEAASETTQN